MNSLPTRACRLESICIAAVASLFACAFPSLAAAADNWAGSIRCEIQVTAPGYSHQETQTWTLGTAAPTTQGAYTLYPATWSATGQGWHDRTGQTSRRIASWTASVPGTGQPPQGTIAFFRPDPGRLWVQLRHGQLSLADGYKGTDQYINNDGLIRPQTPLVARLLEWRIDRIEAPSPSATQLTGSKTTEVTAGIAPLHPGDARVTVTVTWALGVGSAPPLPASTLPPQPPQPASPVTPGPGTSPSTPPATPPGSGTPVGTSPPGTAPGSGTPPGASPPATTPGGTPPMVHLDHPEGGEAWQVGSWLTVFWTDSYPDSQNFDIALSVDNAATWRTVATTRGRRTAPGKRAADLDPAVAPAVHQTFHIRVSPAGNPAGGDVTDYPCTMVPASGVFSFERGSPALTPLAGRFPANVGPVAARTYRASVPTSLSREHWWRVQAVDNPAASTASLRFQVSETGYAPGTREIEILEQAPAGIVTVAGPAAGAIELTWANTPADDSRELFVRIRHVGTPITSLNEKYEVRFAWGGAASATAPPAVSPGAPASAPEIAITEVTPASARPGARALAVSIKAAGTHFVQGVSYVDFGELAGATSLRITSPTTAIATINVDPSAPPGPRTVTMTTPSPTGATETVARVAGFTIESLTNAAGMPTTGRYRVTATKLKVQREEFDNRVKIHGRNNEIFVTKHVQVIDRRNRSILLNESVLTDSDVHGDTNNSISGTKDNRIRSGTFSVAGGIQSGDEFPVWQSPGVPFVFWQGEITDGVDVLIVRPMVWLCAGSRTRGNTQFYEPYRRRVTWQDGVERRAIQPSGIRFSGEEEIRWTVTQMSIASPLETELSQLGIAMRSVVGTTRGLYVGEEHRPFGLEVSENRNGARADWIDRILVLTREKIEAWLPGGQQERVIEFPFRGTMEGPNPIPMGDCTLFLKIERRP